MRRFFFAVFPLIIVVGLAACGGGAGSSTSPPVIHPTPAPTGSGSGKAPFEIGPSKIKHVVFVVQENRSFDDLFGGLDQNGKPFPGADTVSNPNPGEPTPHDHNGKPVTMQQGLLEECFSPAHDHPESVEEVNGGEMNGFDLELITGGCGKTPPPDYAYRYIKESEVATYWSIGEQYAVSDRMFEPFSASSFTPHLFAIAGQSANTLDNPDKTPWGCDAPNGTVVDVIVGQGESPGVFPCFTIPTMADMLDAHGVSWRYYGAAQPDYGYIWIGYDAIDQIRNGPDWSSNVVMPPSQFLTDVANGKLAAITWVTPTVDTSDHPVSQSNKGPAWIASVVDAVGNSSLWNTTAIFITWDDWGGWYDHVPPPVHSAFALGIRVPLIVVSPYTKSGYVSHVVHTTGSVLHFAEEAFGLPSLGQEDARTDDLSDVFNFAQAPRKFSPFAVKDPIGVRRAATESRWPAYVDLEHGD